MTDFTPNKTGFLEVYEAADCLSCDVTALVKNLKTKVRNTNENRK